jgi:hypothetical protein
VKLENGILVFKTVELTAHLNGFTCSNRS